VRTVYRRCVVHAPGQAAHGALAALAVVDGRIAWLGPDDDAPAPGDLPPGEASSGEASSGEGPAEARPAGEAGGDVVDLAGALVTPGFVDAHVHVLETGLAVTGVDLSGARSLGEALELVARAGADAVGGVVLAHGWDESAWPEGRPPTAAEVERAVGGRAAYLARADLHSAVVTAALADRAGCRDVEGWSDGYVVGAAHERAREAIRVGDPARRAALHRAGLAAFARQGVVCVHEHSVEAMDTREGLAALLAMTADPASGLPEVIGYRGELCETQTDARRLAEEIPGLAGVGGDLTVDGSLGSRTAALRSAYADVDGDARGDLRLTAEQVANHVGAVTRAGLQAAFHVIGDRAMEEVLLGFQAAGDVEGVEALRAATHRLEHAEMMDTPALARVLLLGLTVSGQPAFDALWGGPDGMYARRLGRVRAGNLNPFADLVAAGVPLAFGSDSPVTAVDPWGAVRAAVHHHEPEQRLSPLVAFRAHTAAGWRAARRAETGELRVGGPATFAAWRPAGGVAGEPSVWVPDPDGALPDLTEPTSPACVLAVRNGVVLHRETA